MARILVIDDEGDLLEMMRLVLESRGGHEVILSAEGQDGLEKALANPPDLAIIDVMMPGITGYDVCRELRDNPATASLPIIIMTARGQPMDRQAALDAGADEHLTKPVTMEELLQHVNGLLALQASDGAPHHIYTLLSLRGGVGVTTLAVNLAIAWRQSGASTCLVDFCQTSGHAALQLGLRPQPTWADLIQNGPEKLDNARIQSHLLQHDSGLSVLASPFIPPTEHRLTSGDVHQILNALRQRFAVVVVDGSPILDGATFKTLDIASAVGLALTPEQASIQTTVGAMRALAAWQDKFFLVFNQLTPKTEMSLQMLEQTFKRRLRPIGWEMTSVMPFELEQARALAQGAPLTLQKPDSALAQAVRALMQKIERIGPRLTASA